MALLTFERYLREFALPGQPFIMTDVGADWQAACWSLEYFLNHPRLAGDQECTVTVGALAGDATAPPERETTVAAALEELRARQQHDRAGGNAMYLAAWDYVRGGSGALERDVTVPSIFDRSPVWLAQHPVLGNAATDMKWLYIGEGGSGSATHVDTNNSSAWLWVASGQKQWICAHAASHDLIARHGGRADDDPMPDLFSPTAADRLPSGVRLFSGVQNAGEVCFNPSRCVHAVRNVQFTISLTHNFIDATNLPAAIADAVSSMRSDLLPLIRSLKPKKVLKTLQRALDVDQPRLLQTLQTLPDLLSDASLDSVVEAAAQPEASALAPSPEDSPEEQEAVRALLRRHLDEGLCTLRGEFDSVVEELLQLLDLGNAVEGVEGAARGRKGKSRHCASQY